MPVLDATAPAQPAPGGQPERSLDDIYKMNQDQGAEARLAAQRSAEKARVPDQSAPVSQRDSAPETVPDEPEAALPDPRELADRLAQAEAAINQYQQFYTQQHQQQITAAQQAEQQQEMQFLLQRRDTLNYINSGILPESAKEKALLAVDKADLEFERHQHQKKERAFAQQAAALQSQYDPLAKERLISELAKRHDLVGDEKFVESMRRAKDGPAMVARAEQYVEDRSEDRERRRQTNSKATGKQLPARSGSMPTPEGSASEMIERGYAATRTALLAQYGR